VMDLIGLPDPGAKRWDGPVKRGDGDQT
jgi:hypothetical protein